MEETETTALEAGATPARAPADDSAPGSAGRPPALDLVRDLPVRITVEIGRTSLLLREVLELTSGSVLELDRGRDEPADLLVNGRLVARGDLTEVDDRLAVRIVEWVGAAPGAAEDS